VAIRSSATVLHYTSDYDLIAKTTGQDTDWVAPPGHCRSIRPKG
jgi:hypothetical protein